jgi:TATA-box binding protein (TBP) (component of TFIID and TFIIIB)|tara:strand:+ start:645 stop:824 length:180 start_codon:yes stop_codon:yes gene_type:complete
VKIVIFILLAITITGCKNINEKKTSMSDFWKALGSGDIDVLKKTDKNKEQDDGSWEEIK